MLTAGQGMPLAVLVTGANRHDMKLRAATLDVVVVERPEPVGEAPQPLCLDKGDDDDACHQVAEQPDYLPHLRSRGEERREMRQIPGYRSRRWVVDVCHAWLNRFRKLLVRVETMLETHLALLQFACADIGLKRAGVFR